MVYTVFYKTSSFAGYCFLDKNSIHPKRRDVFNFEHFKVTLVKFQICSFIVKLLILLYESSSCSFYFPWKISSLLTLSAKFFTCLRECVTSICKKGASV